MRFTKGMKKALSLALSAAMVLTSAAIAPSTSKAADVQVTPFTVTMGEWSDVAKSATTPSIKVDKLGTYTLEGVSKADKDDIFAGDTGANVYMDTTLGSDNTQYSKDYTIVAKTITVGSQEYTWDKGLVVNLGDKQFALNNPYNSDLQPGNSVKVPIKSGDIVKFTFEVKEVELSDEEKAALLQKEAEVAAEIEAQKASYQDGTMKSFKVVGVYCDKDWAVSDWSNPASAQSITKDGTYTVNMATATGNFTDLNSLWLETSLMEGTKLNSNFSIKVDKVTVGSKSYTPSTENKEIKVTGKDDTDKVGKGNTVIAYHGQNARYTGDFAGEQTYKCDKHKEEHKFKPGSYRVNLINQYNVGTANPKDDPAKTVGVGDDTADKDGIKHWTDAFAGTPISGKAGDKVSLTITVKGMGDAVDNPNANKLGTSKLTVAKKSVVVAAGKSTTVKYTATKIAGYKAAAAVTATSKNKKVAKVSVSGGKVKISVPKKATKGATTTVTVKSGTKSAKIKVVVKNPIKKVKAAKKTVTIKKGKKANVTIKLTATNKKKATSDKVTAKSAKKKVAKVAKVKAATAKKVVISVKALKKGKSTLTVKVGKKTAKVTIKVK